MLRRQNRKVLISHDGAQALETKARLTPHRAPVKVPFAAGLRQVVLYVGEVPLRMKDRVEGPDVSVRFQLAI
jgi:hypothetical protein